MPASVGCLVIDTTDPGQLAPFWCGLLSVQVEESIGDGQFIVLSKTADGLTVGFQQVPEDLDASTAEIEGLGGRWLEPGDTHELEGFRWRCMADPHGNEFDIDTLPPA
jgi:hypothetical protein